VKRLLYSYTCYRCCIEYL